MCIRYEHIALATALSNERLVKVEVAFIQRALKCLPKFWLLTTRRACAINLPGHR